MPKLKELNEIKETTKLKGTIKSGFQSGDSEAELVIAEPLIKHPELNLYRAVDPDTGWKGWVEYTPPVVPVKPPKELTEQELKQQMYGDKRSELRQAKIDLDLGIITQTEYDVLLDEVKSLRSK